MEGEERLQVGLATLQQAAEEEGQRAGERQEDDDEDVGERRGEVAAQLAAHDQGDVTHGRALPDRRRRWSPRGTRRPGSGSPPGRAGPPAYRRRTTGPGRRAGRPR